MKVMMVVWCVTVGMAYLVAGRSFEQALLSGKILFFGFILGFIGGKIAEALHAFRNAKPVISNRRR